MQAKTIHRSDAEVAEVVRKFETCALLPQEFDHRAHLTVALYFLANFPAEIATARMREGLRRLIAHYKDTGYHETITLFWLKLVRRFLDESVGDQRLADVANALLEKFGDSRLLFEYYSRELIQTEKARAEWVEPNLRKL